MSLVACSDGVAVIFGVLYLSVGVGIIDKPKRVKGQFESAVPLVQLYQ